MNLQFQGTYQPFAVTLGTTTHSNLPLLQGKEAVNSKTAIYVCYNKTCQRPVFSVAEAVEEVREH
jgi:uncharacterized protein YyaL (SSP411 family)